ncbi:phosphoribosylformylglycinamidine synthase subunit PurQ [Kamptonema cortianum]|nr:phosphoribosylformylglycinamidine synthase subunit PurQ [Geitlerinema splendidum]MDK3161053.1 phosphoribosylformylglycinamidine synthase subunit PurQ [Kamptonema cortianum]
MRVAVIQFPGSNCDQDALWSLRSDIGVSADYVWHDSNDLSGFDAVFVPGGFSYGDYLRCGAIAARSRILNAVVEFAGTGGPVIGVCNGFQVLCESGLLPGALLQNSGERFICKDVFLKAENRTSLWTRGVDGVIRTPIAHGEGRFFCDDETLQRIEGDGLVAFRYVDEEGNLTESANPNGSLDNIAGLVSKAGNVLGMMPHPERATNESLGNTDGKVILLALNHVNTTSVV